MIPEHYTDAVAFCATADYQNWRDTWSPPRNAEVDRWVDSEPQIWSTMTPRQQLTSRAATRVPFYLLGSLEIGRDRCVDIGCGHMWFRQFYPTLWGVDPHYRSHRDEELTPEWWTQNQGRWHRAISICAMHFCDLTEIPSQIAKVRGLLRPGGRAVVALNRARIQERTQDYQEDQLRSQLAQVPGLTRMVWLDRPRESGMDGNVWLWLTA